jgi:hypothetical protein
MEQERKESTVCIFKRLRWGTGNIVYITENLITVKNDYDGLLGLIWQAVSFDDITTKPGIMDHVHLNP